MPCKSPTTLHVNGRPHNQGLGSVAWQGLALGGQEWSGVEGHNMKWCIMPFILELAIVPLMYTGKKGRQHVKQYAALVFAKSYQP